MNIFKRNKVMEENKPSEKVEMTEEQRNELAIAREEMRWEQRRYEIARLAALQDRRSVILGKLHASNEGIARNARRLADALIAELRRKNEEAKQ